MITGDSEQAALRVANKLEIDKVHAEVLPHDKAKIVKSYQSNDTLVGYIGDGVNDAPALATADVSISFSDGSDLAITASDVTLMKNDLGLIIPAIIISRKTTRNIYQNF